MNTTTATLTYKVMREHILLKVHEYLNKVDEHIFDMNFATNDQP